LGISHMTAYRMLSSLEWDYGKYSKSALYELQEG
jgi:hypothetical protein